jgi:hypothetical protein
MSIAAVTRSKAFGIVSTLFGDCPQLVISMLFLVGVGDKVNHAVILSQVIVSTISLLHQLVLRGLAFLLVSVPHLEQELLDQISDTEVVVECMVAEDLLNRRTKRDRRRLTAVLPLVVDPRCMDANFSTEQVPAKAMEQYASIMGAAQVAHRLEPARIGALLTRLTQSADAIQLWSSGGVPVESSNQCDFAARSVSQYLDRLAESSSASGGDEGGSGGEFRERQRDSVRDSELQLQAM